MKKMILEIHEAGFFSNFNKVVNHLRYSVETSAVSSFEVDWKMPDKNIPRYYADLCGDDLLYREGVTRSQDHGKEIHSDSRIPANNLAKDVLLDCLLLAKADKFIHVTSNIATAVAYINPDLELIYARYDKDDPRALEAVLEHNDDLEVTQFGEDRFELCLGSATNKREVNGFTVLVLRLCNGTRTQTELVNLLREWARNKPISNADIRGLATIRKLLRQGFIKRGELKCPIW